MDQLRKETLTSEVTELEKAITSYQRKLLDFVRVYKRIIKEKEALELRVKALQNVCQTEEQPANNQTTSNLVDVESSPSTEPSKEQENALVDDVSMAEEISQLVEKVKQALGMHLEEEKQKLEECNNQKTAKQKVPSQLSNSNDSPSTQSVSPRRLIKQVALESPPHIPELEEHSSFYRHVQENRKDTIHNQRQRMRKASHFAMSSHSFGDSQKPGSWYGPSFWLDLESQQLCHANTDLKQSSFRIGDECVSDRCSECGTILEEYSDEEIGLCIIILGTFIHREPALAAPLLPDILSIVAKVAVNAMYPWQVETNVHLPGGAISVAHQFLRCILHQLAPNGVFIQMFQTQATESARMQFFRSVSQALLDFNELNPIAPLQLLLECLNTKKTLAVDTLSVIFQNMACYLDCLPIEAGMGPTTPLWNPLLAQLEILFRRTVFLLNQLDDVVPLLSIMVSVLKLSVIHQYKGILDPFSKVLGHAIQTQPLEYHYLVDLCYLCNRAFTKERDKLILCRMMIFELVQALKFKTSIPDSNLLMLINLGLQSYCIGTNIGLNDDTLGGIVKSSIAQYVALEITRSNGRDNRAVSKYFPWLCNTTSLQQGAREFLECIGHVRLLSWLLLGSLTHSAMHGGNSSHSTSSLSQPIPQEASCQIADHIQVIMTGFAEQPKASVLHMSSLFHVFILCQLSEMVSLHFLCMLEALIECRSTFLCKLLPLWTPILFSHHVQLPGHLHVRLQNCRNCPPIVSTQFLPNKIKQPVSNPVLLRWLQRLQFKMGQIELQSSTVTQFYSL